jgi:lysophospholipase L1-like esterase
MRRGLFASIIGVIAVVGSVTNASASTNPTPLQYVALGDSYSAGSGVLPPDLNAPVECPRSSRNFAHVIASKVGAQLTDVTCGGADTTHFFAAQYQDAPPQLDALSKSTQLVTMTIGGNDNGVFVGTIVSCGSAGLASLGQGTPCKDKYGASFENTIRTKTYPSLIGALKATHQRAPRARVAITGYPWIVPSTQGCFDKLPVAPGDIPYVRHIQWTLNDAVRRAAVATGTTFVDLNAVSDGHDVCKPIGTRWVEPVLQGTNAVVVHPNTLGEASIAERVMKVLQLG